MEGERLIKYLEKKTKRKKNNNANLYNFSFNEILEVIHIIFLRVSKSERGFFFFGGGVHQIKISLCEFKKIVTCNISFREMVACPRFPHPLPVMLRACTIMIMV